MRDAVRLGEYLARVGDPGHATEDRAVGALLDRLNEGWQAISATLLNLGGSRKLLLNLRRERQAESVLLSLFAPDIHLVGVRLPELEVATIAGESIEAPDVESDDASIEQLRGLLEQLEGEPPERRATELMDWIMGQVDASRCALIPFTAGSPGPPLAFHLRGDRNRSLSARHVPRTIVEHVARRRQPLVSDGGAGSGIELPTSESLESQRVSSFMAVPVVFRGDLLAVAYVDRLGEPRRFSAAERSCFEAFAYELATPLLTLRDEERRREYRELRDARLDGAASEAQRSSGRSLQPVLDRADRLAPHRDENLLITGETGVGKEVLARHVHARVDALRPFVAINISALSTELFESELMGSMRGAFTGAVDRRGRIADAAGGTLFLDEIGDLALPNQVKLLRFLQDRVVRPVGGRHGDVVDVRVIAATNRPLDRLIASGEFRADLFHRFAPALVVPPLRQRKDEIMPLANRWLESKARQRGVPLPRLDRAVEPLLIEHSWPGNVRQLEFVLSHALLLADDGRITVELIGSLLGGDDTVAESQPLTLAEWRSSRDAAERRWLAEMLARHGDSVEPTARTIGCPPSTLRNLLLKHGLR